LPGVGQFRGQPAQSAAAETPIRRQYNRTAMSNDQVRRISITS
jgi:hypothetical protein